jgi:hypothetical protein
MVWRRARRSARFCADPRPRVVIPSTAMIVLAAIGFIGLVAAILLPRESVHAVDI